MQTRPHDAVFLLSLLQHAPRADIYNLRVFMTQDLLRPFYAASDAVLANSGHEPFGLVGLEAIAAGGFVFTGATGEEYATDGHSAVVVDTGAPEEIAGAVLAARADPALGQRLRRAARERAAVFTWDQVIHVLLSKIQFVAQTKGLRMAREPIPMPGRAVQLALDFRRNRRGVTLERGQDRVVSMAR